MSQMPPYEVRHPGEADFICISLFQKFNWGWGRVLTCSCHNFPACLDLFYRWNRFDKKIVSGFKYFLSALKNKPHRDSMLLSACSHTQKISNKHFKCNIKAKMIIFAKKKKKKHILNMNEKNTTHITFIQN